MLRTSIQLSTVLMVLQFSGCCCLGIPSVRYENPHGLDPSFSSTPICNTCESTTQPACDACHCNGCEGECQPHLFGPIRQELGWIDSANGSSNRPIRNWMMARLKAKQQPEWPRFHPLPTKPAFAPCPPTGDEQQLIYGRFGKIESIPTPDNHAGTHPANATSPPTSTNFAQ